MTESPPPSSSSSSEPPPPSDPPPGWYPDPAGHTSYRWWDGQVWTESTAAEDALRTGAATVPAAVSSAVGASTSTFGPIGPWFAESFRLTFSRFGHFLPMILFFVLAISIPTSFAVWYALRDTVLTFDPTSAAPDLDYGGSQPWLIVAVIGFPVATILSFLAKAAVIRQTWAAKAEQPEPWSASVTEALRRAPRVIPVSLGRTLLYWGLNGLFVYAVFAVSPVFVLAFPFLMLAILVIWVRLAFVGTVAALADPDQKPYRVSISLSSVSQLPLTGRLLLLGFVSVNMILAAGILGAPFTAIVGSGGAAVQPSAETLRLNDVLGPNPSVFALGSLFNALGLGISYVLSAIGTTLLYRVLGGPVGADQPTDDVLIDNAFPSA